MLALVTANGARLDAGSVGLAIARSWSDDGRQVLFVDGDTTGSRLAARFGEATRAAYSPAERGLPSLMAARRPLTHKLLVEHCYSLDAPPGSLWSLFAPFHPAGAAHAAGWLAERRQRVAELTRAHSVIVTSPGLEADDPLLPLLRLARAVVFLAPVATPEQATALGELRDRTGLARVTLQHQLLAVEGTTTIADKTLRAASGLHVVGRLPALEDERILRLQNTRRERAFIRDVQQLAARLLGLMDVDTTATRPAGAARPELFVVAPQEATSETDGSQGSAAASGTEESAAAFGAEGLAAAFGTEGSAAALGTEGPAAALGTERSAAADRTGDAAADVEPRHAAGVERSA